MGLIGVTGGLLTLKASVSLVSPVSAPSSSLHAFLSSGPAAE